MEETDAMPKYYTTEQVADMFAVKIGTVRDWIRDGKLQAVKLGGRYWRVSETELKRFANEKLES